MVLVLEQDQVQNLEHHLVHLGHPPAGGRLVGGMAEDRLSTEVADQLLVADALLEEEEVAASKKIALMNQCLSIKQL
jgi:hypothetical protein